jgi:hypothetical protein
MSLNIKTEDATFKLGRTIVHGSFMTEVHAVVRLSSGRFFNVSFWASEANQWNWGWKMVNGSCAKPGNTVPFQLGPHRSKECDNSFVSVDLSTVTIDTPEWRISVNVRPVYDYIGGPRHRLDVSTTQKVPDNKFIVPPHGIIGQSFDGDGKPRKGRLDVYPDRNVDGEFTTKAMAEGAIEGVASQYELTDKYQTAFAFSRFDKYSPKGTNVQDTGLRSSRVTDYEAGEDEQEEWYSRPDSTPEGRKLSETCDCGTYWNFLNDWRVSSPLVPPLPPISPPPSPP